MTNIEIIYQAAIAAGIYTKNQADAILKETGTLPIHTYQGWKKRGYQVRRGEKAALVESLWRWKDDTATVNVTNAATGQQEEHEINGGHHYTAKAYLFTADQVEKAAPVVKKDLAAYNAMLAAQRKARSAA